MNAPEQFGPAPAPPPPYLAWAEPIHQRLRQIDWRAVLLQFAQRCATLAWIPWLVLFAVPLPSPLPILLIAAALPLLAAAAVVIAWSLPSSAPDTRREALGILIFIDAMTLATAITFVVVARYVKP